MAKKKNTKKQDADCSGDQSMATMDQTESAGGIVAEASGTSVDDGTRSSCRKAFFITSSITLAVYLKTTAPTVVGGDTGELLAEGCQLGTAHPPGYPLYTLLVYAVTQLAGKFGPTGLTPAFCMNCFSCLLGAIASGLISSSVVLYTEYQHTAFSNGGSSRHKQNEASGPSILTMREASAITAGLLHSFSPLTWQYSITAEVFALHNFFVALIIYVTFVFSVTKSTTHLYLGAFLCGLSLTNQHTSVLLEVPVILWVSHVKQIFVRPQILAKVSACFLLGLILYAYLPIAASLSPHAGSWGDVTTVGGFISHFRRKDYGSMKLYSGSSSGDEEGLKQRLYAWFSDFGTQQAGWNVLALFFLVYGWWSVCASFVQVNTRRHVGSVLKEGSARQPRSGPILQETRGVDAAGVVLFMAFVFYQVVFHTLANLPLESPLLFGVLKRFWMHPNLMCFLFVGIGMSNWTTGCTSNNERARTITLLLMTLSTIYAIWSNFEVCDQSKNDYIARFGHAILEPLPSDSLLFLKADLDWNSIRYLQECEGVRPDVTSLPVNMLSHDWWEGKQKMYASVNFPGLKLVPASMQRFHQNKAFTLTNLLDANYASYAGRIFISGTMHDKYSDYMAHYEDIPFGVTTRVERKNETAVKSAESFRKESLLPWRVVAQHMATNLPDENKYPKESWEWMARSQFFLRMNKRASHMLQLSVNAHSAESSSVEALVEGAAWTEVALFHDQVLRDAPNNMRNLGIAYLEIAKNQESDFPSSPPVVEDIFADAGNTELMAAIKPFWWTEESASVYGSNWKVWAKERWLKTWGKYFQMEGAKEDPNYAAMKALYDTNVGATS